MNMLIGLKPNSMKKYHVNIQGIIYEVEADSLNEAIQKATEIFLIDQAGIVDENDCFL